MLFVVLIPAWAWTALMIAALSTLSYQAFSRSGFRHRAVMGLLAVLTLQTVAASSAAIATSHDPISKYACLVGILGVWATPAIVLVEAAVLVLLYRVWPVDISGARPGFVAWVLIWGTLCLILLLAHIRSAALCTV
jgi:hypothetical protein